MLKISAPFFKASISWLQAQGSLTPRRPILPGPLRDLPPLVFAMDFRPRRFFSGFTGSA
jgi:hypothetical protein